MILPPSRVLFDIPEDVAYLNCAYMSPLLKSAATAGERAVEAKLHPWQITSQDFFTLSERARERFAALIGARGDDIALIASASYGISTAAHNLPLAQGKRILVLADEFPSNYYAWQKLAGRNGGEVKSVAWPDDGDWTRALLTEMNDTTGIVAVPHCHWTDGGLLDLPQIARRCKEIKAALVVDGTQSLGALPLSVKEVDADFIVTAGYKWMMGPYTFSYMYAAPRWHNAEPIEESWINRKGSENFARLVDYQKEYQPGARRFDVGEHSNFMLTPIALAATDQLLAWGVENIAQTLGEMTALIAERAAAIGMRTAPQALRAPHMIGLKSDTLPDDILTRLAAQKVYVSRRGNSLRISPHLYNTEADIDRFFDVLGALIKYR